MKSYYEYVQLVDGRDERLMLYEFKFTLKYENYCTVVYYWYLNRTCTTT